MRCTSCKNWCRLCLVGKTPSEMIEELDADEFGEERAQYTDSLSAFELVWESTPGYMENIENKIPILAFARIEDEVGDQDTTNLGVFWTEKVWSSNETTEFPKDLGFGPSSRLLHKKQLALNVFCSFYFSICVFIPHVCFHVFIFRFIVFICLFLLI